VTRPPTGNDLPVRNGLLTAVPAEAARAAHDLGLATWFGGAAMGALALNGASREVDDPTQRLRVANAGWFRWAAVVPSAIGLHVAGGLALGARGDEPPTGSPAAAVSAARSVLLAAALVATAESGRLGRRVVAAGDVPVATAVQPIRATPPRVAAAQRRLRVLQWLIPALTGSLLLVDAWQQHHGGTRLAPHRWLPPALRAQLGA
jgi:hypothetical protein